MTPTEQYHQALIDHQQALCNFDNADPLHVDIAIHQLTAAELRVSAARKELMAG